MADSYTECEVTMLLLTLLGSIVALLALARHMASRLWALPASDRTRHGYPSAFDETEGPVFARLEDIPPIVGIDDFGPTDVAALVHEVKESIRSESAQTLKAIEAFLAHESPGVQPTNFCELVNGAFGFWQAAAPGDLDATGLLGPATLLPFGLLPYSGSSQRPCVLPVSDPPVPLPVRLTDARIRVLPIGVIRAATFAQRGAWMDEIRRSFRAAGAEIRSLMLIPARQHPLVTGALVSELLSQQQALLAKFYDRSSVPLTIEVASSDSGGATSSTSLSVQGAVERRS